MPCHTRMKRLIRGLLWLILLEFGFLTVMSLEPGFLDFDNLPDTNFSCVGKVIGGYYADLETNCQMFHVCTIGQLDEPMDIRFLCLNGTVFDQETRVCERIDEVDCAKSEQFYSLNLELYGNTQPPTIEEELPADVKSTTTTTTTTTKGPKPTSRSYYTTTKPPTTTRPAISVITSHHFPVANSPDIRFNPEDFNISLNPGSPPDITQPISFQQQSYNNEKNTRVTVTTHTSIYKNNKPHRVPLFQTSSNRFLNQQHETTPTPKSVVSYGLTHNHQQQPPATPTEINYGFAYQQTEESVAYHTEIPPHPYHYQLNIANLRPPTAQAQHSFRHSHYQPTTKKPIKLHFPAPTTYRNNRYSSARNDFPPDQTEKPPRLQLPLPLLPTLPPITFSSPSPFSLERNHIETKRFTNDHHSPPRIIISASASVSDNNGRRLNYSLGTIGASHLLGPSPASYDDYKEDDVSLDPFYHDVPKIKTLRHKRDVEEEGTNVDVISDQEAAQLLRFLFYWYSKREKAKKITFPIVPEDITEINKQLAPVAFSKTSSEENEPESVSTVIEEKSELNPFINQRRKNARRRPGKGQTTKIISEDPQLVQPQSDSSAIESGKRVENYPGKENEEQENVQTLAPESVIEEKSDLNLFINQRKKNARRRPGKAKTTRISEDPQLAQPQSDSFAIGSGKRVETYPGKEDIEESANHQRHLQILYAFSSLENKDGSEAETKNSENATSEEYFAGKEFVGANLQLIHALRSMVEANNLENATITEETTEGLLIINTTQVDQNTTGLEGSKHGNASDDDLTTQQNQHYGFVNPDFNTVDNQSDLIEEDEGGIVSTTTEYMSFTVLDTEKYSGEERVNQTESSVTEEQPTTEGSLDQTTGMSEDGFTNELFDEDSNTTQTFLPLTTTETPDYILNLTTDVAEGTTSVIPDYVDDNYEPLTYQEENNSTLEFQALETTTLNETTVGTTLLTTQPDETTTFSSLLDLESTTLEFSTEAGVEETTIGVVLASAEASTSTEQPTEVNLTTTEDAGFSTLVTPEIVWETTSIREETTTSKVPYYKSRPSRRRNSFKQMLENKHRFSSTNRRKGAREKEKLNSLADSNNNNNTNANVSSEKLLLEDNFSKVNNIAKLNNVKSVNVNNNYSDVNNDSLGKITTTTLSIGDKLTTEGDSITDAPLLKSANPTKAKRTKIIFTTTPLSKLVRVDVRNDNNGRRYHFNCFHKKIHQFYSDPRDCRLFHYCTVGYSKNQMVDMKFVCDSGTYFDDEKFICSTTKPTRCL